VLPANEIDFFAEFEQHEPIPKSRAPAPASSPSRTPPRFGTVHAQADVPPGFVCDAATQHAGIPDENKARAEAEAEAKRIKAAQEAKAIAEMKAQAEAKKQAAAEARAKEEALKQARLREEALAQEALAQARKHELEEQSRIRDAADEPSLASASETEEGADAAATRKQPGAPAPVLAAEPAPRSVTSERVRAADALAQTCAKPHDGPARASLASVQASGTSGLADQPGQQALLPEAAAASHSAPLLARVAELQAVVDERERQLTVYAGQAAQ
jgi:colicin import membrane protein